MIKKYISRKFEQYCKDNKTRKAKKLLTYLRRFITPNSMGMGIYYIVNNNNIKFANYMFDHKYHLLTDVPYVIPSYYMYVAATTGKIAMLKLILDKLEITNAKYVIEAFDHTCSFENDTIIYYMISGHGDPILYTKTISILLNDKNIRSLILNNVDIDTLNTSAKLKVMKYLNIKSFKNFETFLNFI